MARTARLVLPGFVHHVLHRGRDGEPVFLGEGDYRYYLRNLRELADRFGCVVHAWCLMLNHVHLLVDPGAEPANLGRLMKHLSGRQAGYAKRRHGRTGALWEGRFRSSPVIPEFLLPVVRYIELNPVRAQLAECATDYRWSSCHELLGHRSHGTRRRPLAHVLFHCNDQYRDYLHAPILPAEWAHIRKAIHGNTITGTWALILGGNRQAGSRQDPARIHAGQRSTENMFAPVAVTAVEPA